MSAGRPVVWIVASDEAASRWAPALDARGLGAHALPWSEARPLRPGHVDLESIVRRRREVLTVLTSANAARFIPDALCTGVRAACVGETTAEAARLKGFDVVLVGRQGGAALARDLLTAVPGLERVHVLHQRQARTEGWLILAEAGVRLDLTPTYEMEARADFSERVAGAPPPAAIALGSPRAADALAAALRGADRSLAADVCVAALGATTAAHAAALFGVRVVLAGSATPAALAEAILRDMEAPNVPGDHHA